MNVRTAARRISNAIHVVREPVYSPPGHFLSPVSSQEDTLRAQQQRDGMALNEGFDLRGEQQLALAEVIAPKWLQFTDSWNRFAPNHMFGLADGAVYYSFMKTLRPKNIVEVGSGFSSAIALDLRDSDLDDLNLVFIEPYPERLMGLLSEKDKASITLYRNAVQEIPLDVFDVLEKDDILFIDSTHVSKSGSDVNWLLFRVLPRLKPGVVVHFHDIFYPFEYSDTWLAERRSWNEAYLLRAFLSFNSHFRIEFFSSWIWQEHPEVFRKYLPGGEDSEPGSIWLRRVDN